MLTDEKMTNDPNQPDDASAISQSLAVYTAQLNEIMGCIPENTADSENDTSLIADSCIGEYIDHCDADNDGNHAHVDEIEEAESANVADDAENTSEAAADKPDDASEITNTESSASDKADDVSKTESECVDGSETNNNKPIERKKKDKSLLIILCLILLYSLCAVGLFPSGEKNLEYEGERKNISADISGEILSLKSTSLSTVYNLPKVYILPWNELPPPKASQDGYGSEIAEDGTEILTYNDETISVKYWCERICDSNCHFAEIKIAHPTQLRTAFAGGEYDPSVRRTPQQIAQQVNAVIAINADFYGYRMRGIIIRQDVTYRTEPRGWDILLIDSDGNFHIMRDYDVYPSGILDEYDIVNTVEFGPSLVVDGEINMLNPNSGCGDHWNLKEDSPRTGIGQLGKLHYLFCCVEGRNEASLGIRTQEFAQIMYDKGCVQAYNLDGGMSTTIIFNGEAMNYPMWGGQRPVTDIFYCTTALPAENGE